MSQTQQLSSEIKKLEQGLAQQNNLDFLGSIDSKQSQEKNNDKKLRVAMTVYQLFNKCQKKIAYKDKEKDYLQNLEYKVEKVVKLVILLNLYHTQKKQDFLKDIAVILGRLEVTLNDESLDTIKATIQDCIKTIPQKLQPDLMSLLENVKSKSFSKDRQHFEGEQQGNYFKSCKQELKKEQEKAVEYRDKTIKSHELMIRVFASWCANRIGEIALEQCKSSDRDIIREGVNVSSNKTHPNDDFYQFLQQNFKHQFPKNQSRKKTVKRKSSKNPITSSNELPSQSSAIQLTNYIEIEALIKKYVTLYQWYKKSETRQISKSDCPSYLEIETFCSNTLNSLFRADELSSGKWIELDIADKFSKEQAKQDEIEATLINKKQEFAELKEKKEKQEQRLFEKQSKENNDSLSDLSKKVVTLPTIDKASLIKCVVNAICRRELKLSQTLLDIHQLTLGELTPLAYSYFSGNHELIELILSSISIESLEENQDMLIELFSQGFDKNLHIEKHQGFYRELLLHLIETNQTKNAKLLYAFIKPIIQDNKINLATDDTLLHLAINKLNIELLGFGIFEGCNFNQINKKGKTPLQLLATLECAEPQYEKFISQLPPSIFTHKTRFTNKTLYDLAQSEQNRKVIHERIIHLSIKRIIDTSVSDMWLLIANGLNLDAISLTHINEAQLSLDERVALLCFQNSNNESIYSLCTPNPDLLKLIIDTLNELLADDLDNIERAQQLLLANNISIKEIIKYYKCINFEVNTMPIELIGFIEQIQQENLTHAKTYSKMQAFLTDYLAHNTVDERILEQIKNSFPRLFEPNTTSYDAVELMSEGEQQRLTQWLNLAFDIEHEFISHSDKTNLHNLSQGCASKYLYTDNQAYFIGELDTEELFSHIIDSEVRAKLEELIDTSKKVSKDYPRDSKVIKHAVVNFSLLAKHNETERAEEILTSSLYKSINNRRARNIIHQLFIWLSNRFVNRTTTSQKAVSGLNKQFKNQGYSATLFSPPNTTLLKKTNSLDDLTDDKSNSYVYIDNQLYFYNGLEPKAIANKEEHPLLMAYIERKMQQDDTVNVSTDELKQKLLTYANYTKDLTNNNLIAAMA